MPNEENPPTCRARVWDSGDKTSCDKSPVLPPGKYCRECTEDSLRAYLSSIKEKERELCELYEGMNELTVSLERALTGLIPPFTDDPNP